MRSIEIDYSLQSFTSRRKLLLQVLTVQLIELIGVVE